MGVWVRSVWIGCVLLVGATGLEAAPYYLAATNLPAQIKADYSDACRVVAPFAQKSRTNAIALWGLPRLHMAGQTRLTTWGNREIIPPWTNCWVFFADDVPDANWAHPCRYIFVTPDLSAVAVQDAFRPLTVEGGGAAASLTGMEVVIPYVRSAVQAKSDLHVSADTRSGPSILYAVADSNCHALIISGGLSTSRNADRFWRDCAYIYATLIQKYGYAKDHIQVYVADGTNPAPDHLNLNYVPPDSFYASTPVDFDGDGECDITGEATLANVSNAFVELGARLTDRDQLFVFVTDHGGPTEGGGEWDVEFALWNNERLSDKDLKALTQDLPCPVFFVLESCYSGGFVDDLNQSNRLVATAAAHDGSSYAGPYPYYYDQWCRAWIAAMRGYFPSNYIPWADGVACNADYNGDGYVSFSEATFFAQQNKASLEHPTYQETPEYLGNSSFLGRTPVNTPSSNILEHLLVSGIRYPIENQPVEWRIEARNPFGDLLAGFTGQVSLAVTADDIIDPGQYTGTRSGTWEYPFNFLYGKVRVQVIYPAAKMGSARTLDCLQLSSTVYPTEAANWTIRMRHTAQDAYPTNATWENEGLTTVYQNNEMVSSEDGWKTYTFSTPFAYNGTDNLMVDYSFDNSTNYPRCTETECGTADTTRSLVGVSDEPGSPLDWTALNGPVVERSNQYPLMRFGPPTHPAVVGVTPTNIVGFSNGVWTGSITFQGTAKKMRLYAMIGSNVYGSAVTPDFPVRNYSFTMAPLARTAAGVPVLQWGSGTGQSYRVWGTTNLMMPFSCLASNIPATPSLNTYTGSAVNADSFFFRMEEE